jgi:hypothetical protein
VLQNVKVNKMAGKKLVSIKAMQKNLMAAVEDTTARIKSNAGNNLGIRNSKFTYKQEVIGRSMVAIAVDFIHSQTWYDTPFDADNPHPPACHALSITGDDMQPLAKSPSKQSEFCDGCPKNAWGSADVGRGKACAQQVKVALVAAGANETLSTAEMAILTVPPTSLKNWNNYVKSLAKSHGLPPFAFYTRFSFDEDAEHPVLTFEIEREIDSVEDLLAICGEDGKGGRVPEARDILMTAPDFSQQAEPRKKAGKKAARKKVAKKASTKKASTKKASKKKAPTKKKGASKFS